MSDDIINELREAGFDAWDKISDPMKEIREMRESEPPPGYVAEPPTEPGWYRVWSLEYCPRTLCIPCEFGGYYTLVAVERHYGKLCGFWGDEDFELFDLPEGTFWNHQRVEF